MSRLTVTEKEHWKERIERRVNRAIATLEAQDLSLMPGITAEADRLAHDALGTAEFHDKIEALNAQLITLKAEQERLERTMYARALGELAIRTHHDYRLRDDFRAKHRKLKEPIEERLLVQSPLARKSLNSGSKKRLCLIPCGWPLATRRFGNSGQWSPRSSAMMPRPCSSKSWTTIRQAYRKPSSSTWMLPA